jgi:hypothetical protein
MPKCLIITCVSQDEEDEAVGILIEYIEECSVDETSIKVFDTDGTTRVSFDVDERFDFSEAEIEIEQLLLKHFRNSRIPVTVCNPHTKLNLAAWCSDTPRDIWTARDEYEPAELFDIVEA